MNIVRFEDGPMKSRPKRLYGFSLLELLAVITILGIIVAIVMPRISTSTDTARIKLCHDSRSAINSGVERYLFDNGVLPNDLDDMDTIDRFPDGIPRNCPVDNALYALDATSKHVVGHDH